MIPLIIASLYDFLNISSLPSLCACMHVSVSVLCVCKCATQTARHRQTHPLLLNCLQSRNENVAQTDELNRSFTLLWLALRGEFTYWSVWETWKHSHDTFFVYFRCVVYCTSRCLCFDCYHRSYPPIHSLALYFSLLHRRWISQAVLHSIKNRCSSSGLDSIAVNMAEIELT